MMPLGNPVVPDVNITYINDFGHTVGNTWAKVDESRFFIVSSPTTTIHASGAMRLLDSE
jgi:hypothetical protein